MAIRGILTDINGVLLQSKGKISQAEKGFVELLDSGLPFRLLTNNSVLSKYQRKEKAKENVLKKERNGRRRRILNSILSFLFLSFFSFLFFPFLGNIGRRELRGILAGHGFPIKEDHIITAPLVAKKYLQKNNYRPYKIISKS